MDTKIINVLILLTSMLGLCIFYNWFYLNYRLDMFREKLFSLRNELFDYALENKIGFDHPSYGMLRSLINSTIRYAHKISFTELVVFSVLSRNDEHKNKFTEQYEKKWTDSLKELEPETRDKLFSFKKRFYLEILEYIIFTSPLLLFTLISIIVLYAAKKLGDAAVEKIKLVIGPNKITDFTNAIDCLALTGGARQKHF